MKVIIGDGFSFSFIACSFLHQYYNLYVSKRPTHVTHTHTHTHTTSYIEVQTVLHQQKQMRGESHKYISQNPIFNHRLNVYDISVVIL